jgi:hypothetical protein
MLGCASALSANVKGFAGGIALFGLLALAGCADRNSDFGFSIERVQSRVTGQRLEIELLQKINLSPDARAALENGVPLHIEVRAELETAEGELSTSRRFEIRYMPLSDHFQLSSDHPALLRTYPRLRHALAGLSQVELQLPLPVLPAGDYSLSTRSWLEKRKLPAPMRLPAWFSPNWQLDSGWQSSTVQLPGSGPEPGAQAGQPTATPAAS